MSSMDFPEFLAGAKSLDWESVKPVFERWSKDLEEREVRNRSVARRFRHWNSRLTIANVFLAAVVATSVFAALNKDVTKQSILGQVLITFIAVVPSIITGILRELQIAAREQGHRAIADEARSLHEDIQLLLALPPVDLRPIIPALYKRYQEVILRPVLRTG